MLKGVFTHYLFHLILETEFEFLQTMFFDLLIGRKRVLAFEYRNQPVIFMMLVHESAKLLVRLHQVRFDFFLSVPIHYGHLSSS